jgi:aerobic carbon-monoxide dehydrogenase medium subunit
VKPAAFDYLRAGSVAEATALLAEGGGATRLLAGGQSLGPMLNLRLARPQRLVDLKRAPELRMLAADDTVFSLGAGWTHAEIEDGAMEDPTRGLLRHVAHGIAYRAVRNRGTIGGSLAHADPAADWVSTIVALGATVVAEGPARARRRIAAEDFVRGAFATAIADDEVLVAVEIPRLSAQARWGYHKLCRKTGEFAKAIGVAVLDPARNLSRVLAGAVEAAPVLLPATSARLRDGGVPAALATLDAEATATLAHLSAPERALRVVCVRRALLQLAEA